MVCKTTTITAAAAISLYRSMIDPFANLEASPAELREQFDMPVTEQRKRRMNEDASSDSGEMTSYPDWAHFPGDSIQEWCSRKRSCF
ncbi:hypothetical protein Acr_00g0027290 [Actinidia rufa]|uniref:Uncharacterized protein n=1 Tax=Actinidia rufa TaxID=165716 RepID=A0A7J0DDW4_9ERIC|nr:hypothetical protein Acr_00g0027290 [Actinidia rufa]